MKHIAFRMVAGALIACAATGAAMAHQSNGTSGADAASAKQAKQLFALAFRPGPKWQPGKPYIEQVAFREHFFYWKELFAQGSIFSAGALGTEHGLVLLYARDQAEADAILAGDPTVKAGGFVGEVRPYKPRFLGDGPLTLKREEAVTK